MSEKEIKIYKYNSLELNRCTNLNLNYKIMRKIKNK